MLEYSPHVKYVLIPIHLLGIASVAYFAMHFSWFTIPLILLCWFVTGCLGTEIGLHRLYSHKAFFLSSKPLRWFMGWVACMGGQWSPIFWAALHRGYHHPHTDETEDIHSPIHGKWQSYMGWLFGLQQSDVRLTYAKDLIRDPYQQILHKKYLSVFWISMWCLLLINLNLFLASVLAVLLAMHQENIVNLFCHTSSRLSYRNFETKDRSVNIYLLGLLFWGQGFHNNHHAKPNRYDFGTMPGEIDICRWIVPALIWMDKICR